MLSIRTNTAAISAINAITSSTAAASSAQTQLSTGYRINSAEDDAAGLQIATRLKAEASGTSVAQQNIMNGISMMQSADGLASTMVSIFSKMKDLATQAADGSSSQADKLALQGEFNALYGDAWSTVETPYAGQYLLAEVETNGVTHPEKLISPVVLQIGAASSATMTVDVSDSLANAEFESFKYGSSDLPTVLTENASTAIDNMSSAIDAWSSFQSAVGAVSNTLQSAYNVNANLLQNTQVAAGRITDTDYAAETAAATSAQMLTQAGTAILKQSNALPSLILSLLQ